MNPIKRLFKYALLYKKQMIFALFLLTVAVAAELGGPFIAKRIIDSNILGIELPWYQSTSGGDAVQYQGTWYKRSDHFLPGQTHGQEVRVLAVGRIYVFVKEPITFDGNRSLDNGKLLITEGTGANQKRARYPVDVLTKGNLYAFYKPEIQHLVLLLSTYLLLLGFAGGFQYGQRYLLQAAANAIIQRMRLDVFCQIQRLPIQYFDSLPAGKIVSRITNDTEAIREFYVTVLATFCTGVIYMVGIFTALFFLNVRLAFICLGLLPLLVLWIRLYRSYASEYNQIIRSRLSDINGMINESIQGMPIIRVFRRQRETQREFEELNEAYFKYQNKLLNLNAMTSHNLVALLRNLLFACLIWYFGSPALHVNDVLTLGVLYAFVDYLNRLFQPITGIVNQLANLEQARVSAIRVFELMDEPGEDISSKTITRYQGNVEFRKVSFAYHNDDLVLKNISFQAKQGQTVALVGHTGSGKSSILNLLFRFYEINQGAIFIDGMEITTLSKQELREHMGIVLQDPFLFTGTIASNVSLGDPRISREIVEKALVDVGADAMFKSLPNGYDEEVLEKGSTLSAGQRQLISFARALAFDPAILILDEATSSIDTQTEAVIQNALEVLKKGRTTFIIAHRLSTIKNADHILVLDHGEIVEEGTHAELMLLGGKYHQMYQLQQGKSEDLGGGIPTALVQL